MKYLFRSCHTNEKWSKHSLVKGCKPLHCFVFIRNVQERRNVEIK